jgi:MoaA/NifB/PqqE/SkfB family radical SAM enzyme
MVEFAQENALELPNLETAPGRIIDPDEQFPGAKLDRLIRQNEELARAIASQNTALASALVILARRLDNLDARLARLDRSSRPPARPLPIPPQAPQPPNPFQNNLCLQEKEMTQGLTKLASRPTEIAVDLSTRCNLSCIMCHNRVKKLPLRDFPMAEWQQVKKMLPFAKVIVFGSAGESLLHPHIEEILADLQSYPNLFKVLTTNAMVFSNDRLLRLVLASINRVGISLEGATARTYEKFRKGASFERLLGNIRRFQALQPEFPQNHSEIIFHTIPMRDNLHEMADLVRLAHSLKVSMIAGQHLICIPGMEDFEKEHGLRDMPEAYNRTLDEVLAVAGALKININMPGKFPIGAPGAGNGHQTASATPKRCTFPWRYMAIEVAGQFSPCCYINSARPSDAITLEDGWNCSRFQEIRATVNAPDKKSWPAECQTCFVKF